MISSKPMAKRLLLIVFSLAVMSTLPVAGQDGKALFQTNCASCHNPLKDGTGPALKGLEDRNKWADHKELVKWINNPGGYMATDKYTQGLKAKFGSMMTPFPNIKLADVDAIVKYINDYKLPATPTAGDGSGQEDNSNAVIFGIISLILAIITLILLGINSNLKKLSDDAEGIHRPEPIPFYRNKVYIAMLAILFMGVAGYFLSQGAIGLGRTVNYEPVQPIFYSHKVHAGINQINCLYCHGNAFESKSATVPSVNVCMNCHKNINEYAQGPQLFRPDGSQVNGTAEIQKLYKYAGFDPKNPNAWDATKAKPIEWVKIHNLPDHVFFSHAQHVNAGNVQCQTCHGEITAMDEVHQVSELSMGWCINCHRNTKVNFNTDSTGGNKFYSIYEKFHNDIKAGKMDSVTVKDIGGLECQKCHY